MKKLLNKESFKKFFGYMLWFLLYAVVILAVLVLIGYILHIFSLALCLGFIGVVVIGIILGITK